jgi:hypothetical protein
VEPCGILLPHVHPRASEIFVVVSNELTFGTRLEIELFHNPLSASPEITGTLKEKSATLFPQGSVHWQVNDSENCQESAFLAILSIEDPGSTTVLQEPTGNRNETLGRRMVGKNDFKSVRAVTPPHIVDVIDTCFARCDIA